MKRSRTMALLLSALLFWSTLPVTAAGKDKKNKKKDVNAIGDRRVARRSHISQEKEIAIGKQYATEIDRSAKVLKDPVVNEYVNRVAQNIGRNSDLTIPLTVKVMPPFATNVIAEGLMTGDPATAFSNSS